MVVDIILDRKNGSIYNPQELYDYAANECYVDNYKEIADAIDNKDETEVKKALCRYIDIEEYSENIKDYIKSEDWIISDEEMEFIEKLNFCNIGIYSEEALKGQFHKMFFKGINNDGYVFTCIEEKGLVFSLDEVKEIVEKGVIKSNDVEIAITKFR